MRIFEKGDVVVVPFPFIEAAGSKRRPALVLSNREALEGKHAVLAMITSRKTPAWPLDTPIRHGKAAGLRAPSKVRMKLFTLDTRLILRKAGSLAEEDWQAVASSLDALLR
jgi:mRNA interferase MazF